LASYFFLMSTVSFFIVMSGMTAGVKAGLTVPFGREFSYWTAMRPRPMVPDPAPATPAAKPQPTADEEDARARREVERQLQDDIIRGGTLMVVGGLFWGLHRFGRRALAGRDAAAERYFIQSQATITLVITGIIGLLSLAVGAYQLLRYMIIVPDEFGGRQAPGETVAVALVFVPVWLLWLNAVVRHSGPAPAGE
jgi:hypothetical protein